MAPNDLILVVEDNKANFKAIVFLIMIKKIATIFIGNKSLDNEIVDG